VGVSSDSIKMMYWGGASSGSGKCARGMTNSYADPSYCCSCDKMTECGVKTAVSSLTRHICQLNSSGLGIRAVAVRKVTTQWENVA